MVEWPPDGATADELALRVTYVGNPIHKTYPSPAGPPALRADEAKCDEYRKRDWPKLTDALRQAIRSHCVGQFRGGFPGRAWVFINDILHEAKLTGQGLGEYHGFPINDPAQYPEPKERLETAPHVVIAYNQNGLY